MSIRATRELRRLRRHSSLFIESRRAGRSAASIAAARSKQPVVVGPWLAEIGFELLYWIPFVRHIASHRALDPARVVVVSRGGVAGWYGDLAAGYLDLFDLFEPDRLADLQARRLAEAGGQKPLTVTRAEREMHACIEERLGTRATCLHPSLLFQRFRPVWRHRESPRKACRQLEFQRPLVQAMAEPERPYVAVKTYFSSAFPDTEPNREAVRSTLLHLASQGDVVTLETGLTFDDHDDLPIPDHPAIRPGLAGVPPTENLAMQTALIANSRMFVGTYGGPSYLAPLLGVPAIGLFSEANFATVHLDVLRHGLAQLGAAASTGVSLVDVAHLEAFWALTR